MGRRRGQPYSQDLWDRRQSAIREPIRSVVARLNVSPSYVIIGTVQAAPDGRGGGASAAQSHPASAGAVLSADRVRWMFARLPSTAAVYGPLGKYLQ
jgi:hypothetical protein